MKFEFGIVTGKTVNDIVSKCSDEVFSFIKQAYLAHESGETINPPSYFFKFPDRPRSRIIALPSAITGHDKIVGMKWIGSNSDNIQHSFPRASATIILNDYETLYPYACLEGSIISAVRTAYSAVITANELKKAGRKIVTLGLVGNGLIARYIYKAFIAQGWDIGNVLLFDQDIKNSEKFINYIDSKKHNSIRIASELTDLLCHSDISVFATSALTPYIFDKQLFHHNPILLNISLRDLAPDILLHSNNIVDDVEHVLKANTSPDLAFQMCGHRKFINGTIGMLMKNNVFIDSNKPTVISPMGMGILDIAVAYFVYKRAKDSSELIDIQDFFYDIER